MVHTLPNNSMDSRNRTIRHKRTESQDINSSRGTTVVHHRLRDSIRLDLRVVITRAVRRRPSKVVTVALLLDTADLHRLVGSGMAASSPHLINRAIQDRRDIITEDRGIEILQAYSGCRRLR